MRLPTTLGFSAPNREGDFNIILKLEESSNPVNSNIISDISDFQECVEDLDVFDHQFIGPLFTWSNKQQYTYLSRKLDRVLINHCWIEAFPSSEVEFQAPGDSHHSPALVWMHRDAPTAMPKPFNLISDELRTEDELRALEYMELLFYKQKAKADWIKEGDQSTRFFHAMVASKKLSRTIRVLYDHEGNRLSTFDAMSNEAINFFYKQLGVADPDVNCCNVSIIKELLGYSLPEGAAESLTRDVSDSEINEAIWGQGNNKSPGPDGGYARKKIPPRCALKIDLQKAFDSLNWDFVGIVLHALGLPEKFIGWVLACITKPSYSIVFNGSLVGYFKGARGVRQGEPLSPYIFVMAMNVLSCLLNVAAMKEVFRFHPKCIKVGLTHLCFTDDLLVFCKGSLDFVIGVQVVLDMFYSMSGLKLNVSKCEIFCTGISDECCAAIKEATGFKLGSLLVRYLGVPLVTRKLAVKDCHSLIDKIRAKLNLWANKYLSFVGRLCSRFFWKGSDLPAKGARVSWKNICLLKSEGGLGVQAVGDWNKACAVHLIKKLLANKGSLWVAWMRAYVIGNDDFWQMNIPMNVSWGFKYILKIRPSVSHLFASPDRNLSTRSIWEALRSRAPKVPWQHIVWFPGRIPKHSVKAWMTILDRIPTRIRL
ncbi:uncharacterized protein LOC120117185 [Hibiscus syriacus]|uniref:uncharacterized protein LOC120117185 n=1 Tax=Hibiscus syriacus TaxID=106335 RepID=UPI0019228DC9|nr:uncharacterized protein LOC120117185 [Hibiscus syriacus]